MTSYLGSYPGTYHEFVEQVNAELGGRYIQGVLTPPSWWTSTTTQWTRYVQEEAAKRAAGMTFTALPQSEIDALHYGGYPIGSPEALNYVRLVEAQGWIWENDRWVRADTGYIYKEPEVVVTPPTVIPTVVDPDPVTPTVFEPTTPIETMKAATFILPTLGLFTLGILAHKRKRRVKK